ncbi:unnamed protein product, partial [Protopolystoma xenopodis]
MLRGRRRDAKMRFSMPIKLLPNGHKSHEGPFGQVKSIEEARSYETVDYRRDASADSLACWAVDLLRQVDAPDSMDTSLKSHLQPTCVRLPTTTGTTLAGFSDHCQRVNSVCDQGKRQSFLRTPHSAYTRLDLTRLSEAEMVRLIEQLVYLEPGTSGHPTAALKSTDSASNVRVLLKVEQCNSVLGLLQTYPQASEPGVAEELKNGLTYALAKRQSDASDVELEIGEGILMRLQQKQCALHSSNYPPNAGRPLSDVSKASESEAISPPISQPSYFPPFTASHLVAEAEKGLPSITTNIATISTCSPPFDAATPLVLNGSLAELITPSNWHEKTTDLHSPSETAKVNPISGVHDQFFYLRGLMSPTGLCLNQLALVMPSLKALLGDDDVQQNRILRLQLTNLVKRLQSVQEGRSRRVRDAGFQICRTLNAEEPVVQLSKADRQILATAISASDLPSIRAPEELNAEAATLSRDRPAASPTVVQQVAEISLSLHHAAHSGCISHAECSLVVDQLREFSAAQLFGDSPRQAFFLTDENRTRLGIVSQLYFRGREAPAARLLDLPMRQMMTHLAGLLGLAAMQESHSNLADLLRRLHTSPVLSEPDGSGPRLLLEAETRDRLADLLRVALACQSCPPGGQDVGQLQRHLEAAASIAEIIDRLQLAGQATDPEVGSKAVMLDLDEAHLVQQLLLLAYSQTGGSEHQLTTAMLPDHFHVDTPFASLVWPFVRSQTGGWITTREPIDTLAGFREPVTSLPPTLPLDLPLSPIAEAMTPESSVNSPEPTSSCDLDTTRASLPQVATTPEPAMSEVPMSIDSTSVCSDGPGLKSESDYVIDRPAESTMLSDRTLVFGNTTIPSGPRQPALASKTTLNMFLTGKRNITSTCLLPKVDNQRQPLSFEGVKGAIAQGIRQKMSNFFANEKDQIETALVFHASDAASPTSSPKPQFVGPNCKVDADVCSDGNMSCLIRVGSLAEKSEATSKSTRAYAPPQQSSDSESNSSSQPCQIDSTLSIGKAASPPVSGMKLHFRPFSRKLNDPQSRN